MLLSIINLDSTSHPFPPSKSPFGHTSSDPAFPYTNFLAIIYLACSPTAADSNLCGYHQESIRRPQMNKINYEQLKMIISYTCSSKPLHAKPHQNIKKTPDWNFLLIAKWVGKVMILVLLPLWTPPLLFFKKGLDSWRRWKKEERGNNFLNSCHLRAPHHHKTLNNNNNNQGW